MVTTMRAARCYRSAIFTAALLLTSHISAFADTPTRSMAQVVAAAKPAAVFIVVATPSGAQSGSGFVINSNGSTSTIVTANHVIEGATQIDVIFDSDEQKRLPATVVTRDHVKDVAILSVALGNRPSLKLESLSKIQEGEAIVLIGYPLATLEFRRIGGDALRPSVHSGIVSAIRFDGALIQFDAMTYHGDSGAPIIDAATGEVVAIVHGSELDQTYSSIGVEQALPGSSFGPSSKTIAEVLNGRAPESQAAAAATPAASALARAASNSASFRVGYGVPHEIVTEGDTETGNEINSAVEGSALSRLTDFLKQDNSLYLIPVELQSADMTDPEKLSGYCDDNRLNVLVSPGYSWNLTGGPRVNGYGTIVGYDGTATATVAFFVFDCFGEPFFVERKSKTENRYFAHRTPDREIVDMTNDLLDQLMNDFANVRTQHQGAWDSLLKTGIAIDPNDTKLHSMMFFLKKPEGYQVIVVAPNGPADEAGVKRQDIIVSVNGTDASTLSPDQIRSITQAGDYTLELQRPGGNVTVRVHPKNYANIVSALQH